MCCMLGVGEHLWSIPRKFNLSVWIYIEVGMHTHTYPYMCLITNWYEVSCNGVQIQSQHSINRVSVNTSINVSTERARQIHTRTIQYKTQTAHQLYSLWAIIVECTWVVISVCVHMWLQLCDWCVSPKVKVEFIMRYVIKTITGRLTRISRRHISLSPTLAFIFHKPFKRRCELVWIHEIIWTRVFDYKIYGNASRTYIII